MQRGDEVVGKVDAGGGQQLSGFVVGEGELRGADLGEFSGQAQLVQAQWRVVAGGHDGAHCGGKIRSAAR